MELSAELQSLLSLRAERSEFFKAVIAHAEAEYPKNLDGKTLSTKQLRKLRDAHTELIAELFYVMNDLAMNRATELRNFILRHNEAMFRYLNAPTKGEFVRENGKMVRKEFAENGILVSRIHDAIIPEGQIHMLCMFNDRDKLVLDQRTIARLLVEQMSFETCRMLLNLLADSGFLERGKLNNCVTIISNGKLEEFYRRYLTQLHSSISKVA